jgi:hypothetical protein
MRLTVRDRRIVLAVHKFRLLSSPQIEALFFQSEKPRGRKTSCQRRLQLLYHHGFLDRIQLPIVLGEGRHPYVYALDEVGVDLVASVTELDRAEIGWKPANNILGPQFVTHALAINDLRVVVTCLTRGPRFSLKGWIDEGQFRSAAMKQRVPFRLRGARVVRNYPDGYFALGVAQASKPAHFFLEVDQGTMTNTRWRDKVKAYVEFRNRGLSRQHFSTRKFRLLAVTTSSRRLRNLKRATELAGGDHYFWFTTQENVDIWNPEQLLEPVWSVATKDERLLLFP